MGLIKAGIGALGGTLADQWKEFFYCESMPKEVLVTKGQKRVSVSLNRAKSWRFAPSPANLHMTPPPNRLFLQAVSGRAL